jgi:hypothetical protein
MNKGVWIGIDLGKAAFHAARASDVDRPADWRALPTREFANDEEGVEAFVVWARETAWSPRGGSRLPWWRRSLAA